MTELDDALVFAVKAKDVVTNFAFDNSEIIIAMGVAGIVVGLILWIANREPKNPGEGRKMKREEYILSRREARQQEQNRIADALEDGLLTALTKGTISDETYRKVHLRLGGQFGFKDMLPLKNLTPEQLKEAIKKRRGHKSYRPVPFPKETPKVTFKNSLERIMKS